ncbi:MAG: LacI family DNA-binding transcriptional regulator [Gammaproteobacteria bacterium]|nr:LacI family DNA-binding transcriptional regulator [Gammaproteobacteria bacterium]
MATIYEVSELAGVSLATVSRVMNNNGKVSQKTRDKVLDAMSKLGYRPNSSAQSLASNRTNSVGVLIPELKGPFFGQLMAGVEEQLRKANKHVIITAGHSEEHSEKDGIEFLLSRNCDAIIVHVEAVSDDYLIELSRGTVPIVIINRYVEAIADKCIYLDNKIGGYLAAKTLLGKGHKNIAYISGPKWKEDSNERIFGHKAALEEAGIEFDEDLLYVGSYVHESGSIGLTELLHKNKKFTALVCSNDEMASGAMSTARKLGYDLPNDLSVIGFDNIIYSSYLFPTLTTINYPVMTMAKMAVDMVLRDVYEHHKLKISNVFSPKLVERNSVASIK